MEKIYRVQMNSKGMPNFSTAVEIPTVNMPIKEKCCFCPHCSNCDVNDDLTIADRPQGDVDAVDIFEREMHNLEQGYITIGEFDERIEPLRHLCYGKSQEWIPTCDRLPSDSDYYLVTLVDAFGDTEICVVWYAHEKDYSGETGWREITDSDFVTAWMSLPKAYRGADDES